jgi:hypothetical protein
MTSQNNHVGIVGQLNKIEDVVARVIHSKNEELQQFCGNNVTKQLLETMTTTTQRKYNVITQGITNLTRIINKHDVRVTKQINDVIGNASLLSSVARHVEALQGTMSNFIQSS